MSVNVSGRQLQEATLSQTVSAILAETGLPPACLKLEITESVMVDDIEAAIWRLNELKALGVLLAVDDFGTATPLCRTYSVCRWIRSRSISRLSVCDGQGNAACGHRPGDHHLCRVMNLNVTGEG